MRVLVIGGMHGNEPLGIKLVTLLQQNPVPGVDAVFANGPAIAANSRFVGGDLNRSFPGELAGTTYESRRAAELLALCRNYDVVLDFHNTHCPDNDCGFVGEAAGERLYGIAVWLGLSRVIVADYDCINKYAPNCLSVEISLDSPEINPAGWYQKVQRLAGLSKVEPAQPERFTFVYRMTLEDRDKLQLPNRHLQAFVPITEDLAAAMGVASPAFPIFVADKYTPYNYGGLLNKVQEGAAK